MTKRLIIGLIRCNCSTVYCFVYGWCHVTWRKFSWVPIA